MSSEFFCNSCMTHQSIDRKSTAMIANFSLCNSCNERISKTREDAAKEARAELDKSALVKKPVETLSGAKRLENKSRMDKISYQRELDSINAEFGGY